MCCLKTISNDFCCFSTLLYVWYAEMNLFISFRSLSYYQYMLDFKANCPNTFISMAWKCVFIAILPAIKWYFWRVCRRPKMNDSDCLTSCKWKLHENQINDKGKKFQFTFCKSMWGRTLTSNTGTSKKKQ